MTFAPSITGLLVIDPYNDANRPNYAAVVSTDEGLDAIRAGR